MSLYLQIVVGGGLYLLDANHVLEVRSDTGVGGDAARWRDEAVQTVDLRALFEETAAPQACSIVVAQTAGPPAVLIVDRVEGLAEFGAAEFRLLPPIGPIGGIIDAVAMRIADQRPLLRMRGERVLAIATAVG